MAFERGREGKSTSELSSNGVLNEQSIHQRPDEEKETPADAGFGKEVGYRVSLAL